MARARRRDDDDATLPAGRRPRGRAVLLGALILGAVFAVPRRGAAQAAEPGRFPKHIDGRTRVAIDAGLAYLAGAQGRDGSWSNRGRYGAYPVAMTALAGIALLMDGNTTTQGRYAPGVDRAARYLVRSAMPNGQIARPDNEGRPMYGHGFGMLFLAELYGMTEDTTRARAIHDVLTRAVALTGRAQSKEGGWYYTWNSGNDEGSVTITQVQGLRAARNAGIAVPKSVIDLAMQYLVRSQNTDGGIRYAVRQLRGGSRPAITAAAIACWYNGGEYDSPAAKRALAYVKTKIKPDATQGGHDFYANLYLAQALYVSNDPDWDSYFPRRRDYFLMTQRPDGSWWGDGVGDIYGTSIALIVLQLPYNQLPIMQQ